MNQLVYLSPLPWSSFMQRPHKFVEWFHASTKGNVLWVEPYGTRFPAFSDFYRLRLMRSVENNFHPPWLKIIKPLALPVEPVPGSGFLNAPIWRSIIMEIDRFASREQTLLAFGKPSVLALDILKKLKGVISLYDAMDYFPAFYSGFSRAAVRRREMELIHQVTFMWASSTALKEHFSLFRPDVQLVRNALDDQALPASRHVKNPGEKRIFGYIGTIAHWFDWEWVLALAKNRPFDVVRLIGPMLTAPPSNLPVNLEIQAACAHHEALIAMQEFDVGLIPFRKYDLTMSVDPIKYYEYRALGLAVVSSDFGEMAFREHEEGIYISKGVHDIASVAENALQYASIETHREQFAKNNTWKIRFSATGLISQSDSKN